MFGFLFLSSGELQDAVPGSGSKDIREDSSGTPQTPQDEDSPEEGEVSD